MTFFDVLWLGIIQAVTEFLPVSSSGHLVVFQRLFGLREPLLAFDVLLHLGSMAAVIIFYRTRLGQLIRSVFRPSQTPGGRRLVGMIILASVPAGIVGLGFGDFIESLFNSPAAVGMFWLLTAALLFGVSRLAHSNRTVETVSVSDALLIGLFQAVAILPGVSRSGSTIAAAMLCGLAAKEAADFAFLIYLPAIFGATVLKLGDLAGTSGGELRLYIMGAVVAAIVSYAAIWFLLRLLQQRIIRPFAWYCLAAGTATLIVLTLTR